MRNYEPVIKKEELEHGAYYKGTCRNATEARWNANNNTFVHWRTKYGQTFLECIKCPEDETVYDVFVATEKLETPTKEINFHL
jgi:hypothetical protein